jgi:SAM-dependent MidA family methyltransferase
MRPLAHKLSLSSFSPFKRHPTKVLSPSVTPAAMSLMSNNRASTDFGVQRDSSGKVIGVKPPAAPLPTDRIIPKAPKIKNGEGIEVSPLSLATCEDIGKRIAKHGGAALIVDYGEGFAQVWSLAYKSF